MTTQIPAIIAPVARSIAVSDLAQAAAFYRDILGFQVVNGDASYGPAHLKFHEGSVVPSVVFFETADAGAMHAAIRARGGHPGELVKVNWIKMQMFEIRDPDGHTLWFGQSYNQPDAVSHGLLERALPELPFDNVSAAVIYYRDVLGFRINYQQHDLGVMDRDQVTILLIARTDRHKGIGSAEFYVADADALYAELRAKGANLQGEPVSHPWGLRDFRLLDPEGNRLTFAQTFE